MRCETGDGRWRRLSKFELKWPKLNGTDENGTTSKRIGGISNIESGKIRLFFKGVKTGG